ncbi:MAG TPA: ABC transporter substrate-binding protein [Chloroflexota bacterium]|nr:ABC transporter substrate-binding protein [Chloroflexota bacterium]
MPTRTPTATTPTRRAAIAGGASLLGALAVACGAGGAGGGASASTNLGPNGYAFKSPVQLTYWKSLEGPRHDAQVKLTDDFNASRSDVKVTLEHVGNYDQAAQKLTAVLAANTPPDVMLMTVDSYLPGFARMGALHPLDDFAKSDKSAKFDTFVPTFIKNGTIDGKFYQVPLARSTPLVYWNRDHFRAAGLPETAPDSWDQVVDVAGKLSRSSALQPDPADGSKFAFPVAGYWWTFQSIAWSFGGQLSDDKFNPTVTQPETVQALQFLVDLVHRHRVARAYKTVGATSQPFYQGQLSFYVDSTANLTQVQQNMPSVRVGTAFMPKQKARAVPGGGSGLTIIKSIPTEKKEAGWEFMKFVTSTPNTVYFSKMTGYMVVRTDAEKNAEFQAYLKENPNAKVTFDQAQFIRTGDSISGVPGVTTAIEDAIRAVAVESQNVKATLDDLQRKMTNLAQDVKKS